MTTESRVKVLLLECEHCREQTSTRPSGARLELLTNGLMLLRFFCLHCYELNILRVRDVEFAEEISEMGVPTTLTRVPAEVLEHPSAATPGISEWSCKTFERLPLNYFNEAALRELWR